MEHVSGINDRKLKNVMRCFAFIFYVFRRSRRSCPTGNSRPLNAKFQRYDIVSRLLFTSTASQQIKVGSHLYVAGMTLCRQVGRSATQQVGMWQVGKSAGRQVGTPAGWQVGRSVGWQLGTSAGRQVGRSVRKSAGRQVGKSAGRLVGRSVGRQVGRSASRQVGRSARLSQAKDRDKSGPESLREFQEKIKRRFAKRCERVRRSGRGGRGWGE